MSERQVGCEQGGTISLRKESQGKGTQEVRTDQQPCHSKDEIKEFLL